MRFLRTLLLTLLILSFLSLGLQSGLKPSDVHYPPAFVSKGDSTAIYVSSMASVKLYATGSGEFFVRDVLTGEILFRGRVSGNGAFALIFPHPGFYEFSGNSSRGITITITPVEVGFPGEQKNAHLWAAALFGGFLVLTLLGGVRK